jgi:hypothetical protein
LVKNNFLSTGADRRKPAQTGANRRKPAQTGADRRKPAIFSHSQNLGELGEFQNETSHFILETSEISF